jgi:hypothetical protein
VRDHLCHLTFEAETFEARPREYDRIVFTTWGTKFPNPGIDVTANVARLQIGTQAEDLRRPSQA